MNLYTGTEVSTESTETQQSIADALKKAHEAMSDPIRDTAKNFALAGDAFQKALASVASDQVRIQEKIANGSRLTQHRFTSRLPIR